MSPPLPADTQASLLSVGMRVRKSVPEGYKTHKTLGTAGYPFPSTAPPASSAPVRPAYNSATSGPRELAPFCGLHKIGGFLAPQASYEPPPSSAPAAFGTVDQGFYAMPGLSLSQGTIASTQGSLSSFAADHVSGTKKRTYEEEGEEDMDTFFDEIDTEEQQSSVAARRIAQPRGMLKQAATAGRVAIADDDFEDAAFLAPMHVDGGGF